MKLSTVVGIVLIVLGAVLLVYQGITYQRQKKVVDWGPLQITHEEQKQVPIHPLIGGVVLAAGAVLVVVGMRKKA